MPVITIAQTLSSTAEPLVFHSPTDAGMIFRLDTAILEAGTGNETPTSLRLEVKSPVNSLKCTLVTFREAGSPCNFASDFSFPGSVITISTEGKGQITILGAFRDWKVEEKHWNLWKVEAEKQGSGISIPSDLPSRDAKATDAKATAIKATDAKATAIKATDGKATDAKATAVKRKADPSEQNDDVKRTRVKHSEGAEAFPLPATPTPLPPKALEDRALIPSALQAALQTPLPPDIPSALQTALRTPLPLDTVARPEAASSQFSDRSTSSQHKFPIFLEQGIRYRITKTGEGDKPKPDQWVRLAYDLDLGRDSGPDTNYHSIKFQVGQSTTVKQKNVRGLQFLVPCMALKEQVEVFMPASFALTPAQTPVIYRVSLREIADRQDGFRQRESANPR